MNGDYELIATDDVLDSYQKLSQALKEYGNGKPQTESKEELERRYAIVADVIRRRLDIYPPAEQPDAEPPTDGFDDGQDTGYAPDAAADEPMTPREIANDILRAAKLSYGGEATTAYQEAFGLLNDRIIDLMSYYDEIDDLDWSEGSRCGDGTLVPEGEEWKLPRGLLWLATLLDVINDKK